MAARGRGWRGGVAALSCLGKPAASFYFSTHVCDCEDEGAWSGRTQTSRAAGEDSPEQSTARFECGTGEMVALIETGSCHVCGRRRMLGEPEAKPTGEASTAPDAESMMKRITQILVTVMLTSYRHHQLLSSGRRW